MSMARTAMSKRYIGKGGIGPTMGACLISHRPPWGDSASRRASTPDAITVRKKGVRSVDIRFSRRDRTKVRVPLQSLLDLPPSLRHNRPMARRTRTDFPGCWHHVMNRGARRAPIFRKDEECLLFFDAVGEAVEKSGIEVHAYALMPNHFHMVVRSVHGNLSRALGRALAVYTIRSNRLNRFDGPVFRGRFRSQPILSDEYLRYVVAYIHLNPVRAHLVTKPEEPCWTSFRAYLGLEGPQPWLSRQAVEELYGGAHALAAYTREVHRGAVAWPAEMDMESGWIDVGEQAVVGVPAREEPPHWSPTPAETVLIEVLEVTGAEEGDLDRSVRGRGGNPVRRFAVWALDRETTLTQAEIGELLGMAAGNVRVTLSQLRRQGAAVAEPDRQWMAVWRGRRP